MKKLLRLIVACTIKNSDEYYQIGMKSMGVDYTQLTHSEISAWKATCRIIEADMLINAAFNAKLISKLKDVESTIIDLVNQKKNNKNELERIKRVL